MERALEEKGEEERRSRKWGGGVREMGRGEEGGKIREQDGREERDETGRGRK